MAKPRIPPRPADRSRQRRRRATGARQHPDGTRCLEGTRSLPPGFTACCLVFKGHTDTCAYDLRYEWWRVSGTWVIAIPESAGGGGVLIGYCPHCGSRLPGAGAGALTAPARRRTRAGAKARRR